MLIHSIINSSSVNGPGNRMVIWSQGCSLNCNDCWNPETHSFTIKNDIPIDNIFTNIENETDIDGITISGGEPFDQPNDLYELTKLVNAKTNLSQIIYSGYTLNEIQREDEMKKVLSNIDVLIDGRFVSTKISNDDFIGSINQKHHFLTDRYRINDFQKQNKLEYHFPIDGSTSITGFPIDI